MNIRERARDSRWRNPGAAAERSRGLSWVVLSLLILTCRAVFLAGYNTTQIWPVDTWNYWLSWHGPLYAAGARLLAGAYIYSPAFAIGLWPFAHLPYPLFAATWSALAILAYAWLLRPLPMQFRAPLLIATLWPISAGNIEWLLALFLVAGPAGWTLPLLTKITPGFVGPAWYAARREWRSLAITLGVPLAIVATSFVLWPGAWVSWVTVLLDSVRFARTDYAFLPPLFVRVPIALLLTAWGALTNRTWILPVAMIIAQPDPQGTTIGLLAALPRLASGRWRRDRVLIALQPVGAVALFVGSLVAFVLLVVQLPQLAWR